MNPPTISQLMLEQFIAGDLSDEAARTVELQLAVDPKLRNRVKQMRADNDSFLRRFPYQTTRIAAAAKSQDAAAKKARLPGIGMVAGSAFATLAIAMIALPLLKSPELHPPTDNVDGADVVRKKGVQPQLHVLKRTDHGIERLVDGAHLAAGETVQLTYLAAEFTYGVILSVDGRGSTTLHFPSDARESTRLDQDGEKSLPFSYKLDDAPNYEKFIFVVSPTPLVASNVLAQVSKQASTQSSLNSPPINIGPDAKTIMMTIKKGE